MKKIFHTSRFFALSFLMLVFISSCGEVEVQVEETKPYSVRMADAEMARNPEVWTIDFLEKPKWDYTQGLICSAIDRVWDATGEQKYLDYIKYYADFMIDENGVIKTYKKSDFNIDRVNGGKFLIELYNATGETKYKLAFDDLRDQMRNHPRIDAGGFWHKKIYPGQMWLDGLYMGSPFLAQYAAEFNEPDLFDDVALQIELIDQYTYDSISGLYYHGYDDLREQPWADSITGLSPELWGRSIGWFAMALPDVLDFMPVSHPKRQMIIDVARKLAIGIIKYQDVETGLWYQVVDKKGQEGNYLEASASSMFAYFLLKASDKGYIDNSYKNQGVKAYQGIIDNFIIEDETGALSITEVCAVAGLGGNPYRSGTYEYYINEPRRNNDPKGVGPFIMASLIYENLQYK